MIALGPVITYVPRLWMRYPASLLIALLCGSTSSVHMSLLFVSVPFSPMVLYILNDFPVRN